MKLSLHHIALGARDVRALARFYSAAFGLEQLEEFEDSEGLRSIWLQIADGTVLMVERTLAERARPSGVDAGPFLLAFRVNAAEVGERVRRMEDLGASVESRTQYSVYFRDPEGNRIAFSNYPLPTIRSSST